MADSPDSTPSADQEPVPDDATGSGTRTWNGSPAPGPASTEPGDGGGSTPDAAHPHGNSTEVWKPQRPTLPPGGRLGRYELRRVLGRGGMGIVYEAWDTQQLRRVALKTLHGAATDGTAQERFLREARAAGRLRHPGIVTVLDVDFDQGRHFFTMEYVDGQGLDRLLKSPDAARVLPMRRRVEIVAQVAEALGCAHRAGIIHRDVKPSNILVAADGRALLSDFGLAGEAQATDPERITLAGIVLGTPQYVSPEQATGGSRRAVPASDVYSLGCVLFRVLSGRLPFAGEGARVIEAAVRQEAPLLRSANPGAPEALELIAARCLRKKPEDRYEDGAALASDLRAWLDGRAEARTLLAMRPVARRSSKRWPVVAGMAGVAVASVVAVLGYALSQREHGLPPSRQEAAEEVVTRGPASAVDGSPPPVAPDTLVLAVDRACAAVAATGRYASAGPAILEARAAADAAIRRAPGEPAGWLELARLHDLGGAWRDALDARDQAVKAAPGNAFARGELAWSLVRWFILEQAEEALHDGRPQTPLSLSILRELASVLRTPCDFAGASGRRAAVEAAALLAADDIAGARASLRRHLEQAQDPQARGPALLLLGALLAGDERRQAWTSAAEAEPGSALAEGVACMLMAAIGREPHGEFKARTGRVAALAPRFVEPRVGLAIMLGLKAYSVEGFTLLNEALLAQPRCALALATRGRYHLLAGREAEAEADYTQAIELDPSRAWMHVARSGLRSLAGDTKAALADLEVADRLLPGKSSIALLIGAERVRAGDPRGAIEAADRALGIDRGFWRGWMVRAQADLLLGDAKAGLRDSERALELAPDDPDVLLVRAECLLESGAAEEAIRLISRSFVKRDPTARTLAMRATCRRRAGDIEGSRVDADLAVQTDGESPEAWLALALARSDGGDAAGAGEAARRALENAPAGWKGRVEAERLRDGGR